MASKSQIDKAGIILSNDSHRFDETWLESDYIFEEYRKKHLSPLTNLTHKIQEWLQYYNNSYFIAQRLKRKPQILRKLRRLSVRLTQLQDIGGCRIIVEKNSDVNNLVIFIREKISLSGFAKITKETDYRESGRDDTGYRAYHIILDICGVKIELQLRSQLQHYWSESIERTSVIYGFRLKEKEGDPIIIDYYKTFSNALHEIESGYSLGSDIEIILEQKRIDSEKLISQSSNDRALGGHVNSDIIKAMAEREGHNKGELNNWILVFDWTDGNFITWDVVGRNADEAIRQYSRYEMDFPEKNNYEVVLIGTSDISTVPHTHSHYFGIEHHNAALEKMEKSIIGISKRCQLDIGARKILMTMHSRKYWDERTVLTETLKNHFCKNVATFESSLNALREKGFITGQNPISLNIKRSREIEEFV
ncbi:ppGpp synthetase/RelA/SpoT-type nucleotidyltransferase [Azospirillum fermentarium]|uniref:RelA/SpoT domain-containing protein n=1 Tax=Azospirillum fermentarium TaxID=1233114 RepID=UPI0022268365|nr:RelA/SpoT domain-containing protein [Azospirillum fermentarium]MCW2248420.1 ppGpp synthetase/RelA/SpoT-type nucleotidyltransferase [Azospirillum fermentarium]